MAIRKAIRKKYLLLFLAVAFLSGFLIFYFLGFSSIRNNIESGELEYTCNCGWVDWSHARPQGPEILVNELFNDSSQQPGTKTIVYRQRMKINLTAKRKLVAEISRTYKISGFQSKRKREEIAFSIFKETSESFEKMQGSFPFILNLAARRSSFKEGDLAGNRIAFYRALRGYTKEQVKGMCKPVSRDSSLRMLEEGKFGKNSDWQPHFWLSAGTFPKELNELGTDSVSAMKELIFLEESKRFYFEY